VNAAPDWLRSYLKIPYAEANCGRLVGRVLREQAGLEVPWLYNELDRVEDARWLEEGQPRTEAIVADELASGSWSKVETPERFDVALYSVDGGWHVGVVIDPAWGLITTKSHGSHPYRLRMWLWAQNLEGYYRYVSRARSS